MINTWGNVMQCPKCAYVRRAEDDAPDYECPKCGIVYAKYDPQREVQRTAAIEQHRRFENMCITTANYVPGRDVAEVVEIISAECAFGMNIFKDLLSGVSDIFGGRSGATQNVLRDARRTVLADLRREACAVGADAVIAVDLDYSEFSGGGKSMLFVVASGTAVKLKPLDD